MRFRFLLIVLTALVIPLSFVHAPYPDELILQQVPTLLGLLLLAAVVVVAPPTGLSFSCLLAFLWLHIIGARWIYTFVPYDEVVQYLTGTSLSDLFGWRRNHYDRLVHFASGILFVPPASELLQRAGGMRPRGAAVMAIAVVLAIGATYEILEWLLTVVLSPEQAQAYNGQQGDIWDPQKDMALAGLGAIVSAGLLYRWTPSGWRNPPNR